MITKIRKRNGSTENFQKEKITWAIFNAVTAVGGDLEEAIKKAYAACKPISFQDMHFRTDIGKV